MSVLILPEFQTRTFTEVIASPAVEWWVPRFSWASIGGPVQAEVFGYGSLSALAAMFDRLRCPVILRSPRGVPLWWGYVYEVELRYDAVTLGATLEPMGNWVTILYSEEGSADDSEITAPAIDDRSVAVYGIKELRENQSQGNEDTAEARRDLLLAQQSRPIPKFSFGDRVSAPQIRYGCRGWWSTLWWRYWLAASGAEVSITQQVSDIVAGVGQFFTQVLIGQPSAITADPARDGTIKAGDIVVDLLKQGAGGGLRSLATVTPERVLRILPEPERPQTDDFLLVTSDGYVHTATDAPLPVHIPPIGRWARVRDIPPTLTLGTMQDPSEFFLEDAEFDAGAGRWSVTTRGMADVYAELFSTPM